MIDHLLRFPDEQTAQADLIVGTYWTPASPEGPGGWRGHVCIPGVGVYQVTGTQTLTNPDTGQSYQQETRQAFPGWFLVIALPALDPALQGLSANSECRLIADRDAAAAGQPFILYLAPDIDPAILSVCRVEPVFAGSDYPFAP